VRNPIKPIMTTISVANRLMSSYYIEFVTKSRISLFWWWLRARSACDIRDEISVFNKNIGCIFNKYINSLTNRK